MSGDGIRSLCEDGDKVIPEIIVLMGVIGLQQGDFVAVAPPPVLEGSSATVRIETPAIYGITMKSAIGWGIQIDQTTIL